MRIRLKLIFSKLIVNLWYERFTRYEKLINSYLCIPNLNIGWDILEHKKLLNNKAC